MKWWFQTFITPCPVYSLLMTTHSILHHSQLSLRYMNTLSPFKKHINMDALTEWSQNTGHTPVLDGRYIKAVWSCAVPHHHGPPRRPSKLTTRSPSTNKLLYSNLLHYTIKTCRSTCENFYLFFLIF